MARKHESPSSILTFKQCPRKYFYRYIAKYPTLSNVHQIRGNIAHKALENFYDIENGDLDKVGIEDYEIVFRTRIKRLLKKAWFNSMGKFRKIDISRDQHIFYYRETQQMMQNWISIFFRRLKSRIEKKGSVKDAFLSIVPDREKKLVSDTFHVLGYIDAIEKHGGKIRIMDYKTSKCSVINGEHKLQLAIYSLLYYEKFNIMPDEAGIYFLKHDKQMINVDEELLELARLECMFIRENTQDEDIVNYPKKESPLCKWSTGQCDFYDICFNGK